MLHKLRARIQSEKGFTLIELLVVILIIGILAAIAIPAFLGQRQKAQDTQAKTQARSAQTAFETIYSDKQTYKNGAAAPSLADLQKIEPTLSTGGVTIAVVSATDTTFKLTATSDKTNNVFTVEKKDPATVDRTCTTVGTGGCPGDGKW
jgi:type IV pilus assembly protein PilA